LPPEAVITESIKFEILPFSAAEAAFFDESTIVVGTV
jgi:hypothetical protein